MERNMDESRKQFEQTYEQLRKDGQTINLWDVWSMAWQASRAAIEIELPDAADYWNGTEGHEILNHRQLMADSADAIRAAGIKVKE
ncbi:hypothetical protein ABDJ68_001475 [Enterobacter ludwigii]